MKLSSCKQWLREKGAIVGNEYKLAFERRRFSLGIRFVFYFPYFFFFLVPTSRLILCNA